MKKFWITIAAAWLAVIVVMVTKTAAVVEPRDTVHVFNIAVVTRGTSSRVIPSWSPDTERLAPVAVLGERDADSFNIAAAVAAVNSF